LGTVGEEGGGWGLGLVFDARGKADCHLIKTGAGMNVRFTKEKGKAKGGKCQGGF